MKYRTIVADPPWPIKWSGGTSRLNGRGTRCPQRMEGGRLPYPIMSIDDISALPVATLAENDAHLFLWVTAAFNREGIGVRVARNWGFDCVAEIVWEKMNFGLGAFPRPTHEVLLVCRRGVLPFAGPRNVRSVQRWATGQVHSQKPDAAIDLIEQVSPGPYVELFSRRHRLGWDVWGNESANTAELGPVA